MSNDRSKYLKGLDPKRSDDGINLTGLYTIHNVATKCPIRDCIRTESLPLEYGKFGDLNTRGKRNNTSHRRGLKTEHPNHPSIEH